MVPTRLRRAATPLVALAVFLAGLTASAAAQEKGKGSKDKERLQGTWKVVSAEKDGAELPKDASDSVKLTFRGDTVAFEIVGQVKEGTFKLHAGTQTRGIDLMIEDKTVKGIYAFDGKHFKLCAGDPGTGRPKEFSSQDGRTLVVFQQAGAAGDKGTQKQAGDEPKTEPRKGGDLALIQGSWEVESAEKGGEKLPEEFSKAIKLTIKGEKATLLILGETKEGTIKLDPMKKPKTIDITSDDGTIKGIYELTRGRLKVCASEAGGERPTAFKGEGAGIVVILKQVGGAKQDKGTEKEPGKKGGAVGLNGTWKVVSAEKGGEKLPDEITKSIQLTMKNGKLTFQMLDDTKTGSYKIDPSKKPATIDVTMEDKTGKGIYELKGNKLKICSAEPGEARPKEFSSEGQLMLVTLERVKGKKEKGKEEKKSDEDKEESRQRELENKERAATVQAVREVRLAPRAQVGAANRDTSVKNLKVIGLAMHNYHDTYRFFPPAAIHGQDGKPLLSWRVAILPFIEQGALYKEFRLNEPWDSEHNKKLLAKMPKVYAPVGGAKTKVPDATFYQVFTGPGTIFDGAKGSRLTAITDGTSNTILAVEAGEAVPWTKPDDVPFDATKKELPKLGGLFREGFNALMADGSVRWVTRNFDPAVLRQAITSNGGEVLDLDKLNRGDK